MNKHVCVNKPDGYEAIVVERYEPVFYRMHVSGKERVCFVFLHGLGSNHSRWNEFIASTSLLQKANLLVLDLKGHGYSPMRMRIGHRVWCEDIRQIARQENINQLILVGHSLGAQTALHFYHFYPELVKAIVLLDPIFPTCLHRHNRAAVYRFVLNTVIGMVRFVNFLGIHRRRIEFRDLQDLDNKVREMLRNDDQMGIEKIYMRPSLDLQHNCLSSYLQDSVAIFDPLPQTEYRLPVLALFSKHSSVMDVNKAKRLALDFGFDMVEIDANHWMLTEQPQATREAIDRWCLQQLNI